MSDRQRYPDGDLPGISLTPEREAALACPLEIVRAPCPRCGGKDSATCSLCDGFGVAPQKDERDSIGEDVDAPIPLRPIEPRSGSVVDLVEQLRELVRSAELEEPLTQARARSLAHRVLVELDRIEQLEREVRHG